MSELKLKKRSFVKRVFNIGLPVELKQRQKDTKNFRESLEKTDKFKVARKTNPRVDQLFKESKEYYEADMFDKSVEMVQLAQWEIDKLARVTEFQTGAIALESDQDKENAEDLILTEIANPLKKQFENFSKDRSMSPEEKQVRLRDMATDLQTFTELAIRNGLPGAAAVLTKQRMELLNHPSAMSPPDDREDEELTPSEVKARKRDQETAIAVRRNMLQETINTLEKALVTAEEGTKEHADLTQQLENAKREHKFAGVKVKDPYRAALYQENVRKNIEEVEKKFALAVPEEHRQEMLDRLGTKLSNVIDEMMREAVFSYLCKKKNDKGHDIVVPVDDYASAMDELMQNPEVLYGKLIGLKDVIEKEAENFATQMSEVLDQSAGDKEEVGGKFFPGKTIKGLKDIIVADSDPHNSGRRVTILTFVDDEGKEHRIVNKPRDVRVDSQFVGTTGKGDQAVDLLKKGAERKQAYNEIKKSFQQANPLITDGDFKEMMKYLKEEKIDEIISDNIERERLKNLNVKYKQLVEDTKVMPSLSEVTTALMREPVEKEEQRIKEIIAILKEERDDVNVEDSTFKQSLNDDGYLDALARDIDNEALAGLLTGAGRGDRIKTKSRENFVPVAIDLDVKQKVAEQVKGLPTYNFLGKEDESGHPYGWVEFVEHGRPEDCILDEGKVKQFYGQMGQLSAMGMLFGIEDLHNGNVMIREGQPVLTDLEIAFSSKHHTPPGEKDEETLKRNIGNKFSTVMIDKGIQGGDQQKFLGIGKVENNKMVQRDDFMSKETTDNLVAMEKDDGTFVTNREGLAGQFKKEMIEGFKQAMDVFGNPDMAEELDSYLESFEGHQVRYHIMATPLQLQTRRMDMANGYVDDVESRKSRKEKYVKSETTGKVTSNPKLEGLIDITATDLANRDVAYFTQPLGTRKILHNGKEEMKFKDDTDLMETDGLGVVRQNLKMARDPKTRKMFDEEATSSFNRIQSVKTGDPGKHIIEEKVDLYAKQAKSFLKKGENENAINVYKKALELDPENEEIKEALGKLGVVL